MFIRHATCHCDLANDVDIIVWLCSFAYNSVDREIGAIILKHDIWDICEKAIIVDFVVMTQT